MKTEGGGSGRKPQLKAGKLRGETWRETEKETMKDTGRVNVSAADEERWPPFVNNEANISPCFEDVLNGSRCRSDLSRSSG